MHRPSPTRSSLLRSPRGRSRALLLALGLACLTRLGAIEPLRFYPELVLRDGRKLLSVEVVNYTMTEVLVRHAGGATTVRGELLPATVATDLHLLARPLAEAAAAKSAYLALADKVAVADPTPRRHTAPSAPANFVSTETTAPTTAETTLPPFSTARSRHVDLSGRVAVKLPSGELRLVEGAEIRAYPAHLLDGYLSGALARSNEAAQKLLQQAAVAANEGRTADYTQLAARARKTAEQYLNLLPLAPFTARSDAHGHFTLSHDLKEARIVAAARVTAPNGEWSYQWIGLTASNDTVLTETNATAVAAPEQARPRFAAR